MLHFARWKVITILVICALGILYALPNLFSDKVVKSFPSFIPSSKLSLGLDLRGGSHLLMEMDVKELKANWFDSIRGDVRQRLRKARIGYTGLRALGDSVEVRIRKPEDFDKALTELKRIAQPLEGSIFAGTGRTDLTVEKAGEGVVRLTPSEAAIKQRIDSAMSASIETIRRRVDELGTTEPNIQRQGLARILIQVPGEQDPERVKRLIGKTAKLNFHLVHPSITPADARRSGKPVGYEIFPGEGRGAGEYLLQRRAMVEGQDLVDSQPAFDSRNNEPVVSFRLNSKGARRFGKVTQENVGRLFAIVLDGKVISAPRIQEPILGGAGQITGQFTPESSRDLAILLRSGALPAKLTIVEAREVGPSLGADSITAGEIAAVVGLVAVLIFMIAAYGGFGLFANAALLVNIALIIGTLSILQATLTLPGIAGIVLTIGMAVDANVLIFERIREEIRSGKTAINAIESGYSRALGTILDANITTFIAAAVLFMLGAGPIRGFAVTLSIGIFTSVFTAFVLTRLMISFWLRGQRSRSVTVPI